GRTGRQSAGCCARASTRGRCRGCSDRCARRSGKGSGPLPPGIITNWSTPRRVSTGSWSVSWLPFWNTARTGAAWHSPSPRYTSAVSGWSWNWRRQPSARTRSRSPWRTAEGRSRRRWTRRGGRTSSRPSSGPRSWPRPAGSSTWPPRCWSRGSRPTRMRTPESPHLGRGSDGGDGGECPGAQVTQPIRNADDEDRNPILSSDRRSFACPDPRSVLVFPSLHGDAFGEVAWLVDVAAAQEGDLVGQQLQRDRGDDWLEILGGVGHLDQVIGQGRHLLAPPVAPGDHRAGLVR